MKEIVDLSATDSPLEIVWRLIAWFNNVMKCHRNSKETLPDLVSILQVYASESLMHSNDGLSL